MNCSDWQMKIAAEMEDPAIAEHVSDCEACREFAQDLAANAVALRSIDVDAAAYMAVRTRVLGAVRPRRRFGWLWASAAMAVAAFLILVWWTVPLLAPVSQPRVVAYKVPVPETTAPSRSRLASERRGAGTEPRALASGLPRPRPRPLLADTAQKETLTTIKLLTDDPDVVIIWLVDKKGDSL